jgi:hypothetical protein
LSVPKLSPWQRELALAALLLAMGLVVLPIAVYWVGQHVVGDYAAEGGLWGLVGEIWAGLGQANFLAWALVLSPYVVIQLARGAWLLARHGGPGVTSVTVSKSDR